MHHQIPAAKNPLIHGTYIIVNIGGETIHFDQDWKQLPYFISSRETAFEMSMINQFDAELLLGQVSYSQRADIYNYPLGYEYTGEKKIPLALR